MCSHIWLPSITHSSIESAHLLFSQIAMHKHLYPDARGINQPLTISHVIDAPHMSATRKRPMTHPASTTQMTNGRQEVEPKVVSFHTSIASQQDAPEVPHPACLVSQVVSHPWPLLSDPSLRSPLACPSQPPRQPHLARQM
jgi:hypothetical protein